MSDPRSTTNSGRDTAGLERAAKALARDARVQVVYAFGSRSRGSATASSDYDMAILIDGSLELRDELRLRARVVEALDTDRVDLVVLNTAPPLLRFEVVSTGRRLYARDELAADRFEERATMEFLDTAHMREVQYRLARESLA